MLYPQSDRQPQNAYIERFNRTARQEWLGMHLFHFVAQAQPLATRGFGALTMKGRPPR